MVVLTLGTFDGVHRGHQRLLAVARRRARANNGEVLAVAFERPPRLFFHPASIPSLLTTPPEKEQLLRRFGADRVETVVFSKTLAQRTADQFFHQNLRKRWGANEIVVGFNFCFGKGREANVAWLQRRAKSDGVVVHGVGPVRDRYGVISSGRIRSLLAEGRLEEAETLLGHAYSLEAIVVRGRGVGRRLGYPTANLAVSEEKILPSGVFAVTATLPTGVERRGLLNVGVRPTFQENSPRRSVEVHLLDFSGNLVGRRLRLLFRKKLRDEKKFPSVPALVRQIRRDEHEARHFFSFP